MHKVRYTMPYYATEYNLKLRTYLERTKMAPGEIDPRHNKFWPSNSWKCTRKKRTGNNIICRLYRGKMEQILIAYGLPKEIVSTIIMLYRNTKVKFRSPDGDTNYFDLVAGVQ